jgi:enoyl-CoA hydratase
MELLVKYATDEKVGIVTLNRPAKLNALSKELRVQLLDAFCKADDDPATCVVILRGEGRSFCVGYDITGGDPAKEAWKHDALKWHENLRESLALELMPWDMKKPVIASVQGHALGGGCELAMLCDITIAASDASFGEPEVRFSNLGPAIVMPWLIGFKKARELLYMGDSINAEEALRLGMINKVVPVDELRVATLKFARRMTLISRSTHSHNVCSMTCSWKAVTSSSESGLLLVRRALTQPSARNCFTTLFAGTSITQRMC